jgi:predicted HicB family RNase H-like nuclease
MVNETEKRPAVRIQLVRLSPEVHRAFKLAALEEDRSAESILRELIGQYLRERADERELVGK